MLKFIFRAAFIAIALFIGYAFGGAACKTVWYRMTGTTVEGRIEGFTTMRNGTAILEENTGVRKGKRKARPPVFKYPVAVGATDSLQCKSSTGVLFTFLQYDLNERVPVVFATDNPADAYIFSYKLLFTYLFILLLGLVILVIGITGKG